MQPQMSFLPFYTLWLMVNLPCFVIVLLVLKYAAKLKWLTAICLSVFAVTIFFIMGLRFYPGHGLKAGTVFLPAAVCVVIMVIDFFRWTFSSSNESVNNAERNRILKMVEDGKIGSDEASGLLDAMGRADAFMGQDKFSKLDIVMLVGVALVVLGFFLPWVYIKMQQTATIAGEVVNHQISLIPGYQAGYQVGAIGWAVLIVGIASAIPIFITPKNFLYKISMMQIFLNLIGIVIVVSLLLQLENSENRVGVGLIMCLTGFIVGIFATAAKFKKLAA